MRWYTLSVFICLAVYFIARRGRARSRSTARLNLERHLGAVGESRGSRAATGLFRRIGAGLERTRYADALRQALEDSGLNLTWQSFKVFWILALVLLPLLAVAVTGSLLSAPPSIAAALAAPRPLLTILRRRAEAGSRQQCEQLASDLALYLRCGIPVEEALALCSADTSAPLSDSLRRFHAEVSLGAGAPTALLDLVDSLGNPDLELIARAAVTARETGSDIRGIMGNVGEAVRERAAIRRELSTQTVQGRMSGRIVAGLPFLFLGLSAVVSKGTLSVLFGTAPGLMMLAAATVLNALGFLWIRRIMNIKN